ncbi:PilZ domain-containing protein [Croceicoccus ponticola]|uniref:PilZ domain-containing protein n=1 Tax=Croceicoccus ponticola TaxID=2217664 RepID=UPI0013E32FF4|nr:PilZ domain-containing protein [Croceicoccus ponticola]
MDIRTDTVFAACLVEVDDHLVSGLLRNVSQNGAQIEIDADLEIGSKIVYDDGLQGAVEAAIIWKHENCYGVRNSQTIGILSEYYFERANAYRGIRIPISFSTSTSVEGESEGENINGKINNISLSGAQVECEGEVNFEAGRPCELKIRNLLAIDVYVRWSSGKMFGVKFSRNISINELVHLIDNWNEGHINSTVKAKNWGCIPFPYVT